MHTGLRHGVRLVVMGLIMTPGFLFSSGQVEADLAVQRDGMLRAVERDVARYADTLGSGRLSAAVACALETVPRHVFVPARFQDQAYGNHPLPIGHGQTISQPTIVAVMTELLGVAPGDTVLEVGTGSGYQAAILGEIAGHVHTIEIVPELARSAADLLEDLEYANVTVHAGDGYAGLPDLAPFAAIMVTAAPPEVPSALLAQLAPGGRLVVPIGPENGTQWLTVFTKGADGTATRKVVMPVRFVPMVGRTAE